MSSSPGPAQPGSSSQLVTVTANFKLVFISVLVITLLSLTVAIILALSQRDPSEQVKGIIEMCSTTFKLGFGAIVGLIGGKAL